MQTTFREEGITFLTWQEDDWFVCIGLESEVCTQARSMDALRKDVKRMIAAYQRLGRMPDKAPPLYWQMANDPRKY